eukprot:TRINITY_DN49272_c0_g1_i1.p2 TRINITY_DN49272_c0_g1~~TRINITY_DN49272_c0_g1_i1.p2  ORF type:complete len:247 (-),score=58.58 TRINITY_DN49272_c0_g1_i1:206-946(-)
MMLCSADDCKVPGRQCRQDDGGASNVLVHWGDERPQLVPLEGPIEIRQLAARVQALEDSLLPRVTRLEQLDYSNGAAAQAAVVQQSTTSTGAPGATSSLQDIQDIARSLRADGTVEELARLMEGLVAGVQMEVAACRAATEGCGHSCATTADSSGEYVQQTLQKLQGDLELQAAKLRLQTLTSSVFTLKCFDSQLDQDHRRHSLQALEAKQSSMQQYVWELERSQGRAPTNPPTQQWHEDGEEAWY